MDLDPPPLSNGQTWKKMPKSYGKPIHSRATWEKKSPKPSWQAFTPPPPTFRAMSIWQHISKRGFPNLRFTNLGKGLGKYLEHSTCTGIVNDENDVDDKKCFGRCLGSPLRGTVNSSVRPPALQRFRHHQSCFHHYHHSEDYFDHRHYHCSQCCMLEEGLVWIPFHSGRPNDLLFPPPSRPNCT